MRGSKARKLRQTIAHHIDAIRLCDEKRQYGWTPLYKGQKDRMYWADTPKPTNKEESEHVSSEFMKGNRLWKVVPLQLMDVPGRLTYKQLKKQIKFEKRTRVA